MKTQTKMKGVIIGTGAWGATARRTAERASRMTGIEFVVIDQPFREVVHPSWLKLWVSEHVEADAWLIMDADIIPLKPWDPQALLATDPDKLWLARDHDNQAVTKEAALCGLDRDLYCNTGFLLFGQGGAEILKQTREFHPAGFGNYWEQSCINKAVQRNPGCIRYLPRAYNCVAWPERAIELKDQLKHSFNVHVVALRNDLAKFDRVWDLYLPPGTP